jgi:hypothetical protein
MARSGCRHARPVFVVALLIPLVMVALASTAFGQTPQPSQLTLWQGTPQEWNGTTSLCARLSSGSHVGISGSTIVFTLFGQVVGSATTVSHGFASVTVSLAGHEPGSYAGAIGR